MKLTNSLNVKYIKTICCSLLILFSNTCFADNQIKTVNNIKLDLSQSILLALSNNYQLKINQINPDAANKNIEIAKGSFDPSFFTKYSQLTADTNPLDESNKLTTTNRRSEMGIQGKLLWGTQYSLALNANSINNNIADDSATFTSSIEIIQPLLKGFGRDSAYAQVKIAKQQRQIAEYDFQLDLLQLIQNVTNAYIDFHVATEELKIAELNWSLAEKTLADEKKRIELGRVASSDIFRPNATYAQRHSTVLIAQRNLKLRESRLKSQIFSNEQDLLTINLVSSGLPNIDVINTNVKSDYLNALKKRPEYHIAKISLKTRKTESTKDKQDRLPQLDLVARLQNSGVSNQTSFSTAYDNYNQFGTNQTYIGLNLSVPITNGIAKNRYARSQLKVKQAKLEIKHLEHQMLMDLDFAAFNLKNSWQRVEAARVSVDLAEKTLDAEEQKMSVGRSSSFFVLDLQSRLAGAKSRQTLAMAGYVKSMIEYQRQTGNLLEQYGVKTQDFY